MNYIISRKADLRFGNGSWNYTAPAIGHHHYSLQIIERLRMDFWRGLLNPALRPLPEPLLAIQLEDIQAGPARCSAFTKGVRQ